MAGRYRLSAERAETNFVKFIKRFDSFDAAMKYVFALDEAGKWAEGADALLADELSLDVWFLDGDRWSPVDYS